MTLSAWAPPDELKPAPEPLLLVQAFVNTRDRSLGTDLLDDADAANQWLHQCGLLAAEATAAADDLRAARDVREGLRALIVHNGNGPAPTAGDLRPLQEVACSSRPRLSVDPAGRVQVDPGSGRARRRAVPAPAHHPRRAAGRHLAAAEGLRQQRLPLGVLRPLPQPPGGVVRHGVVRKPDQEQEPESAPQPPAAADRLAVPPEGAHRPIPAGGGIARAAAAFLPDLGLPAS